eukprot:CAMPEP_0171542046 /NCGR_PEP_ID=MMETSP0960-20121227/2127_1 /TAXON_ID=87120 /ORGANISM="Aurantiochytrium limacinum, Strain ATCCMYA-1381" /LENGTH=86 /DNA_ID=CAMNT_0012089499 /DNA_START=552 /DNA_END=809 /DNA_ORIENTATION=+
MRPLVLPDDRDGDAEPAAVDKLLEVEGRRIESLDASVGDEVFAVDGGGGGGGGGETFCKGLRPHSLVAADMSVRRGSEYLYRSGLK